jgi:PPP family 3-phenylpropionic acid transporter
VTPTAPAPHSTKPQYFLVYAVLGSVVPFLSVLLAERGLSKEQIGTVWAASSFSVTITPLLVTLLADTAVAARVLMGGLYALAAIFLVALIPIHDYRLILVFYALHTFALQPIFPLQDGVHFAAQQTRKALGLAEIPYHTVRVWGTIGYIVPAVALFFVLRRGASMTPALACGAAFCAAGVAYAFRLPRTPPPPREQSRGRLPTAAAWRALRQPRVLLFCLAMFLIYFASQAYYQFYPLHLTERAGFEKQWVGLIANIGVVGEICFMFAFPWFRRAMGLRALMTLGTLAIAGRLYVLAAFPGPVVAIAVQAVHGLTVLVIHVVPPIFLNDHATDEYRNSIQGLYAMAFAGLGKILGAQTSGHWAQHSLPRAFNYSAGACVLAAVLLFFAFAGDEKRKMKIT